MTRYSRSGTRRSGDDYQDIVLVQVLVDWLANPDSYNSVRTECDDAGSLDDIFVEFANGAARFLQVKFSTDPTRPDSVWTWDRLLEPTGPNRPSRLAKWARDLERLLQTRPGQVHACLVTNAPLAAELRDCLGHGRIVVEQLPQEVRMRLASQLSDSAIDALATAFSFVGDEPGLSDLERDTREEFLALNGTEQGWLSLNAHVRRWVGRKGQPGTDGSIRLAHVRLAAGWGTFSRLAQEFHVPDSFVLTSATFDARLRGEVLADNSPICVVTGTPGSGKSTYLSHLVSGLRAEGHIVVRHHYYLSDQDTVAGRIDHLDVLDSLLSQLVHHHPESVAGLEGRNPGSREPGRFRAWAAAAAKYAAARQAKLVLVVDGLDHVWRERRSTAELVALFEELLPPVHNVTIVVGTQRIDPALLPRRLLESDPGTRWFEIGPLGLGEIGEWVRLNADELGLELGETELSELAAAFLGASGGHPLILSYTLRALLERSLPVTPAGVRSLPVGSPENLDAYYHSLWAAISAEGRQVLHLFAVTGFPWRDAQIVQCLGPGTSAAPRIVQALAETRHLLRDGPLGLRPFHASLSVYVALTEDHLNFEGIVRDAALLWLETMAPDYWRLAFRTRLLSHDATSSTHYSRADILLWMRSGYPSGPIRDALGQVAETALQRGDLAAMMSTALALRYVRYAYDFRADALSALRHALLERDSDPNLRAILLDQRERLGAAELAALASAEHRAGHPAGVRMCFDALNEMLGLGARPTQRASRDEWREQLESMGTIVALLDELHERGIAYAKRLDGDSGETFMNAFAAGLGRLGRSDVLIGLVADRNLPGHRGAAVNAACTAAESSSWMDPPAESDADDPRLWMALAPESRQGRAVRDVRRDIESLLEETVVGGEDSAAEYFADSFWIRLAEEMGASVEAPGGWAATKNAWLESVDEALSDVARLVSADLRAGTNIDVVRLWDCLSGIEIPMDRTRFRERTLLSGLRAALIDIVGDLSKVGRLYGSHLELEEPERSGLAKSALFQVRLVLAHAASAGSRIIRADDFSKVGSRYLAEFAANPMCAWDATNELATLARVAILYGDEELFAGAVDRCVEFLLSYGDHKDMLLDHVLSAAKVIATSSPAAIEADVFALASPISAVTLYTDGDETSHLPGLLGRLLVECYPANVQSYVASLMSEGNYHVALDVFAAVLRSVPLDGAQAVALASTGVEPTLRAELNKRAVRGDRDASAIVDALFASLGERPSDEKAYTSESRAEVESESADPGAFAPETLAEFMAQGSRVYAGDLLARWHRYWEGQGQGRAACAAAFAWLEGRSYPQPTPALLGAYARYFGREKLWQRMVNSDRQGHGWIRYWGRDDAYRAFRDETVRTQFPRRWMEYLQESLLIGDADEALHPLTTYLVHVGQIEEAVRVVRESVKQCLASVAHLRIGAPRWLPKT